MTQGKTTQPPGWKLVPIEPTDQMLEEICCCMDRTDWVVHARQAWQSVLYSTPEYKEP